MTGDTFAVEEVPEIGFMPPFLASEIKKLAKTTTGDDSKYRDVLTGEELWKALDAKDDLKKFRKEFCYPSHSQRQLEGKSDEGENQNRCIYLCGHSLGLMPRKAREYVDEELNKWASYGVEAHDWKGANPWISMNEIGLHEMNDIIGAKPDEIVHMGSLSSNLHNILHSFYQPTNTRNKVLVESKMFSSDYIIVTSQISAKGYDPNTAMVVAEPREGETTLRTEDILKMVEENKDSLALVLFAGINHYSGQLFEIEKITKFVKKASPETFVGWDLAHVVGNVPLSLHDWDVDFACWCTYKYLSSGPGGIGGAFVHEKHTSGPDDERVTPRFPGWWGHRLEDRFHMDHKFIPTPGAFGWQQSNPPILCLATLRASLEIFKEASMAKLRFKSVNLTRYLELLLESELPSESYSVISPGFDRASERGSQLSISFSFPVNDVLAFIESEGVICDVRKPKVMRVAPIALYNSFEEVWRFVKILKKAIKLVSTEYR